MMGHRVKIHKITPTTDKERGDIEIKDYVVMQKPQKTLWVNLPNRFHSFDSGHYRTLV